jgi:nitric oxide reductase NorQ protein
MKVIVSQIASTTSANKKHYTMALTENGVLATHYGSRTASTPNKSLPGRGRTSVEDYNLTSNVLSRGKQQSVNAAKNVRKAALKRVVETFGNKWGTRAYNVFALPPVTFEVDITDAEILLDPYALFQAIYDHVNASNGFKDGNYTLSSLNTEFNKFATDPASVKVLANINTKASTKNLASKKAKPTITVVPPAAPVQKHFVDVEPVVTRPNGERYYPREVMGHTDVALLRTFHNSGIYVRLAGPPGSGKTALAEAAFKDVITVSGHGDMTVAHFVGSYLPDQNGGWHWNDGPLVRAMREGKTLFVDEGTRIPTEVLNILFSVMDGRNVLRIDDRPDLPVITGIKGFYVIMGYNPDTLGARPLDEALVSRFRVQIDVTTDFDSAKKLGVPQTAIRIAKNLQTRDAHDRRNEGIGVWVPQMRELITFRDLVDVGAGEKFALATLLASCPRKLDLPLVQAAIEDVSKEKIAIPSLGRVV